MENEVFAYLQELVRSVLQMDDDEELTMDTEFINDLGADSLDVFQIVMAIEDKYGISISNEEAMQIATVGDAVRRIVEAKQ